MNPQAHTSTNRTTTTMNSKNNNNNSSTTSEEHDVYDHFHVNSFENGKKKINRAEEETNNSQLAFINDGGEDDTISLIKTSGASHEEEPSPPSSMSTVEQDSSNVVYSWVSYIMFSLIFPVVRHAFKQKSVDFQNLIEIPTSWKFCHTTTDLEHILSRKKITNSRQLFFEFVKLYWKNLAASMIFRLIGLACEVGRVFALERIFRYTEDVLSKQDENSKVNVFSWEVLGYLSGFCLAMFVCKCLKSAMGCYGVMVLQQIGHFSKNSLLNAIYKKSLRLSSMGRNTYTSGTIMNICTTDTSRLIWFYYHVGMLSSVVFTLITCVGLVYYFIGVSAFVGFSMILVIIPLSYVCMNYQEKLEEKVEAFQDKRSEIISQMVSCMRFVKLYALEKLFRDKIMNIRDEEMKTYRKAYISVGGINAIWYFYIPSITFLGFLHFCYFREQTLTMTIAFTVLTILDTVHFEMIFLPESLIDISKTWASMNRILNFLNADEIEPQENNEMAGEHETAPFNEEDENAPIISFKDATLAWEQDEPVLKNINLDIKRGEFCVVIGRVGQGKSSILSSILGELKPISGSIEKQPGCSYSYVSQESWIRNETIRDNIMFGEKYDEEKYMNVVHACSLETDFSQLMASDLTVIGEKGINLSGGQKMRVSLARSFYSDTDVYILDDPLSAVDVHTADHILEYGIFGLLKNKTVVMVSNHIHFIQKAHKIVVVESGSITQQGTFDQLYNDPTSESFRNLINEFSKVNAEKAEKEKEEKDLFDYANTPEDEGNDSSDVVTLPMNNNNHVSRNLATTFKPLPYDKELIAKYSITDQEEEKSSGLSIKKILIFAVGVSVLSFASLCLFGIIQELLDLGHHYILTLWSSDEEYKSHSLLFYLLGYSLTSAAFIAVDSLGAFVGLVHYLKTAKIYHERLMTSIINTTISFFDTTPLGRIVTRFTKDTNAIDGEVNWRLREIIPNLMFFVGGIIFVVVVSPFSLLAVVVFGPIIYFIQVYYRICLRELESIGGIVSSPVNSHIAETIQGLQTIRAYNKQKFVYGSFVKYAENDLRANFNIDCIHKYFEIRNDLVSALCIAAIILISVISFPGSMVGMIVVQASSSFDSFYWILYLYALTEKDFVSVERVEQYSFLESEKYEPRNPQVDTTNWPQHGEIIFHNVSMRYKLHNEKKNGNPTEKKNKLVLKGINAHIKPKERVSICGRTGAGKSSLLQVLFRLQEIEEDDCADGFIKIDGIDIRDVPLTKLRSEICIIPQQPTLFKGTLRENLDSYGQFSDREIWQALEQVNLKDKIQHMESSEEEEDDEEHPTASNVKRTGLDILISENGENISAGTRQLICLARALMRKCKILVLDEATSCCDLETDKLIQKTLREAFSSHCTVLCIAHRLETIMDYDRVLVIDDGRVIEFDSPQTLLNSPNSLFSAMACSKSTSQASPQFPIIRSPIRNFSKTFTTTVDTFFIMKRLFRFNSINDQSPPSSNNTPRKRATSHVKTANHLLASSTATSTGTNIGDPTALRCLFNIHIHALEDFDLMSVVTNSSSNSSNGGRNNNSNGGDLQRTNSFGCMNNGNLTIHGLGHKMFHNYSKATSNVDNQENGTDTSRSNMSSNSATLSSNGSFKSGFIGDGEIESESVAVSSALMKLLQSRYSIHWKVLNQSEEREPSFSSILRGGNNVTIGGTTEPANVISKSLSNDGFFDDYEYINNYWSQNTPNNRKFMQNTSSNFKDYEYDFVCDFKPKKERTISEIVSLLNGNNSSGGSGSGSQEDPFLPFYVKNIQSLLEDKPIVLEIRELKSSGSGRVTSDKRSGLIRLNLADFTIPPHMIYYGIGSMTKTILVPVVLSTDSPPNSNLVLTAKLRMQISSMWLTDTLISKERQKPQAPKYDTYFLLDENESYIVPDSLVKSNPLSASPPVPILKSSRSSNGQLNGSLTSRSENSNNEIGIIPPDSPPRKTSNSSTVTVPPLMVKKFSSNTNLSSLQNSSTNGMMNNISSLGNSNNGTSYHPSNFLYSPTKPFTENGFALSMQVERLDSHMREVEDLLKRQYNTMRERVNHVQKDIDDLFSILEIIEAEKQGYCKMSIPEFGLSQHVTSNNNENQLLPGGNFDIEEKLQYFVFCDLQGCNQMWSLPHDDITKSVTIYYEVLRKCVKDNMGVDMTPAVKHDEFHNIVSDSVVCAFETAKQALKFTLLVHTKLMEADWPDSLLTLDGICIYQKNNIKLLYRGLRCRMGVVARSKKFKDTTLQAIKRATMIAQYAQGGQTLVESQVMENLSVEQKSPNLNENGNINNNNTIESLVQRLDNCNIEGVTIPRTTTTLYLVIPRQLKERRFKELVKRVNTNSNVSQQQDESSPLILDAREIPLNESCMINVLHSRLSQMKKNYKIEIEDRIKEIDNTIFKLNSLLESYKILASTQNEKDLFQIVEKQMHTNLKDMSDEIADLKNIHTTNLRTNIKSFETELLKLSMQLLDIHHHSNSVMQHSTSTNNFSTTTFDSNDVVPHNNNQLKRHESNSRMYSSFRERPVTADASTEDFMPSEADVEDDAMIGSDKTSPSSPLKTIMSMHDLRTPAAKLNQHLLEMLNHNHTIKQKIEQLKQSSFRHEPSPTWNI
ncbi:hypothetical protein FDP41_006104 [Naegleria fowleri]|uniref:Uncharacterized protein n=1 Tax=Naegleria fowleri TaxID=5763 RepID=A0A6A5BKV1_NAEFO|nr:uncharacterized protein FDP41_006104 [Naegleria fowleri]KAF0974630.1 hypothetical protein FDP41_006104 [Naegleria fowleri]